MTFVGVERAGFVRAINGNRMTLEKPDILAYSVSLVEETMKRDSPSGLWHRCGTCGTPFSSIQELYAHLETHTIVTVETASHHSADPSDLLADGIVNQEPITVRHQSKRITSGLS